jgi:hypothetical protein
VITFSKESPSFAFYIIIIKKVFLIQNMKIKEQAQKPAPMSLYLSFWQEPSFLFLIPVPEICQASLQFQSVFYP